MVGKCGEGTVVEDGGNSQDCRNFLKETFADNHFFNYPSETYPYMGEYTYICFQNHEQYEKNFTTADSHVSILGIL